MPSTDLDNFFTLKMLWWYRHILDTDGNGVMTHKDFERSALKYAILYCKGDRNQEIWDMVTESFEGLWELVKGSRTKNPLDTLTFHEWHNFIFSTVVNYKQYADFPKCMQQLIDLLFESYDAYNDNALDENEYRLYLCARNMDMRRAEECFKYMTGGQKGAKLKRQQFYALMVDFLTSKDDKSKGKYICGPYDSAKREILEKYYASV